MIEPCKIQQQDRIYGCADDEWASLPQVFFTGFSGICFYGDKDETNSILK